MSELGGEQRSGGQEVEAPKVHLRCDPRREEDRPWVERRRIKLREGTRRRRLYDGFFLPLDEPTSFTGPRDELVRDLMPKQDDGTPDEERTKEVLAEAQAIYASADERIEGAQSRATTLQGAVAIAASFLLAGGALLADPAKVRGDCWRVFFALALFGVVFALVMSGARALAATSTIHVFHRPTASEITLRTGVAAAEARIELAAETLRNYACNTKVADWKVAYLGAAAWWFRWALVGLLVLAALLGFYGVFGPDSPPAK